MLPFATICEYISYYTVNAYILWLYNMLYIDDNADIGSRIYVRCSQMIVQ